MWRIPFFSYSLSFLHRHFFKIPFGVISQTFSVKRNYPGTKFYRTSGTLLIFIILFLFIKPFFLLAQLPTDPVLPAGTASAETKIPSPDNPAPSVPAADGNAPQNTVLNISIPLWEREPFDRIILKNAKKRKIFDIQPLVIPEGVSLNPDALRKAFKTSKLQIRLLEDPENLRQIPFSNLDKILRFEDILIEEARQLILDKNFDDAYECLKFVRSEYPETRNLNAAYQFFLEREAANYIREKNYEMALVRVYALAELNPKYARLPNIYVPLVKNLWKENLNKKNYAVGGQFIREIQKILPDHPDVKKLVAEMNEKVEEMKADIQKSQNTGNIHQAILVSREMMELSPDRKDVINLAKKIREQYPQVNVGITWCATQVQPVLLNDWASLRTRRLIYRPLVEFRGPGPEGGEYISPLGTLLVENLNRTLRLNILPEIGWDGTDVKLTAYDISRQLLRCIDSQDVQHDPLLSDIFQSVEVSSPTEITLHLRQAHVLPKSLLQMPVLPFSSAKNISPDTLTNGPFVPKSFNDKPLSIHHGILNIPVTDSVSGNAPVILRYSASSNYFLDKIETEEKSGNRPLQIIETKFDKGRNASVALIQNQIQVLDRVNPWELSILQNAKEHVTVTPYAVPRTHVLLPNRNKPLLSNRIFRRALVYGINRDIILSHLLGKKSYPGCQVISGPFSVGASHGDPLAYAYDSHIPPRKYDPYLAALLARVAISQVLKPEEIKKIENQRKEAEKKELPEATSEKTSEEKNKSPDQNKSQTQKSEKSDSEEKNQEKPSVLPMEPLILAHPPHELARISCLQIQRQLAIIGIPVTLYEFKTHETVEMREDFDLIYAELTMAEPLLDARRLLSAQGPTGRCSSHMDMALRQLDAATDWNQISRILKRIHRLCYDDTAVIPLWQILDHYAYHNSVEGIGEKVFSLYENIEEWQLK
ncbi:MAG: ABC transporter substrate-binding protein [Planctomycetia bacterium]|nr:ABC transporter substrate-binding protein [Planctomycetia bacterium]